MKNKIKVVAATGFFLLFFLFFTAISFHRFYILQVFHYDFGVFARIIWQLSRLQLPFINHVSLGRIFFLGDHFNPSLLLLAPLFWLTSDLKILLVEQAIVTVAGGVMIFLIGRKLKLSYLSSLVLTTAHLFFAGIGNPVLTDWHPEPTAGFLLLFFFYLFVFTHKRRWSYIVALIFLGFKESNAITLSFLLLWLLVIRKNRAETIFLLTVSLIWFFTTTKILIPLFVKRAYFYSPELPSSLSGMVENFFDRPAKIKLTFDSLGSFAFLPILSFVGMMPIIGELAIRFIPDKSFFANFTLTMHHNVYLGCFLSLAAIYGVVSFKKWLLPKYRKRAEFVLILYLLAASFLMARKVTFSPVNLAVNPIFWQELGKTHDFFSVLPHIPKRGSVLAQNNLLSHLVPRRDEVYLFSPATQDVRADIVLFDVTVGNVNNFWPANESLVKHKIELLLKDGDYKKLPVKSRNLFIFIKNEL